MSIISENRKAYFNYEITETIEAGIELKGFEVKAVKNGRINIAGAFVFPKKEELWLTNADIPAYQPKNAPTNYDPKRTRRLLLNKSEIKYLIGAVSSGNLRLLPLKVYTRNNRIKLELGLGKIKKKTDKRSAIIKRVVREELGRRLKEGVK